MTKRAIGVGLLLLGVTVLGVWALGDEERHQLLVHRIGPSGASIHVAGGNGAAERALLTAPGFDYNASVSVDGKVMVFTSERDGSADLYRVNIDGTGLARLTDDPAYDDQATLSPDGATVAFVSSRGSRSTDIWVLDVATRQARRLTSEAGGDFRPRWSPDGRKIAFSSDRGTEIERDAPEWEHLQRTSIYLVNADGTGLQRLTSGEQFAGSPSWSPDGRRIAFYEMPVVDTHKARGGRQSGLTSQIVSVDIAAGDRREHTSGAGLKISPQYVGADRIGYLVKAGPEPGIAYTTGERGTAGNVRNPSWSADGSVVTYDRGLATPDRKSYALRQTLFSGDPGFELAHASTLAAFSRDGNQLVYSQQVAGTGNREYAIELQAPGETAPRRLFYQKDAAAMFPQWSPDDRWIVFGLGVGFQSRNAPATIMMMRSDGSDLSTLASGQGAGFPSFSPDGTRVVYRVWGPDPGDRGLRVLNLATSQVTALTTADYDTFPGWSPTEELIAFSSWRNGDFDMFTIKPDGTGLKQLTTAPGNDAHSSWSPDGKYLMFASSRYGFKDEAPLFDGQPQPYGEIFIMNADGTDQRQLTDNQWEDGPGTWAPARGSR